MNRISAHHSQIIDLPHLAGPEGRGIQIPHMLGLHLLLLHRVGVFLRRWRLLHLGRRIPRAVIGKEGRGRLLLVNHGCVSFGVQGDPKLSRRVLLLLMLSDCSTTAASISASLPLIVFLRYLLGDPIPHELSLPLRVLVILILDLLPESDLLYEPLDLAQPVLSARVVKQLRVLPLFNYARFRRCLQIHRSLDE